LATPTQSRILKFTVFEVDLAAGELRKSGMRQKIAGQPFEVLGVLLERPGEIVTREELQQRIWPKDTFVDYDLALRKAITRLREVLGDSAENPRFIETVPRKGYRFIAPLKTNGAAGPLTELSANKTPPSRRNVRIGIVIGIVLVIGAAALSLAALGFVPSDSWHRLFGKATTPQIRSIAVLPLQNLSADPAQEYFSDGLTDALITDLAQLGSVKVISRTSSMQYKQTKRSLPEIAHELNVDGIIEGAVQRSGDRVRITAQLVHGPSDKHLWAGSYERDMRDIFALERDVTEEITRQVRAKLRTPNNTLTRLPVSPKALDLYLQGNYYLVTGERHLDDEEKRKAGDYFQQAIDLEPNFAPAYIGLANAHSLLALGSREDAATRRAAGEKAFALDASSSDALVVLGDIRWMDFDWAGAEQEYRQALALNPNSAAAHEGLGYLVGAMGRLDEGLREAQLAQELDPNEDHLDIILEWRGDYDRAIELDQKLAQIHPYDAILRAELYRCYLAKGAHPQAIEELVRAVNLVGRSDIGSNLWHAFTTSGYRGAMKEWAKALEQMYTAKQGFWPEYLGAAYAAIGDKDRAFYWLNQAYEHREMVSHDWGLTILKVDPLLAPLRSDPRFNDLLRRVGLPPE
jgi:TolB-like protein/DNA-binding winged helix-turn-helix (wHTH) protein